MIGGIIVESKDMEVLNNTILELKTQKGCVDELKWVKTNDYRYKSYCQIVDKFFELNNSALFCFHSLTIDQHKVNHSIRWKWYLSGSFRWKNDNFIPRFI